MSVLNTWAEAADMHESVGSFIVAASATTTCSNHSHHLDWMSVLWRDWALKVSSCLARLVASHAAHDWTSRQSMILQRCQATQHSRLPTMRHCAGKQQSSLCTLASDPTWRVGTAYGCLKASTLPSLASGVMAATWPCLNTEAERRGPRSCCAASPSSPTLCRARLGEAGSSSSLQAEPPRDRPGRGHTECQLQGRGRAFLGMCACVVCMCGSDRDAGLMSGAACACRAACRCESPWPPTRQRQTGWLPWIQAGVLSPDGTAVPSRPLGACW